MRIRWKPRTRGQEIALAAVFLIVGLIFTLGEAYWYAPIERENALTIEAVYQRADVHRRRNRDHHIEVILAEDMSLDIPLWIADQTVETRLERLEAGTPVRLLAHPNSDIILEMTAPTETILDFETSRKRLAGQRRGMMALGVMMLCGALALLLKRRRPARR